MQRVSDTISMTKGVIHTR